MSENYKLYTENDCLNRNLKRPNLKRALEINPEP